MPKILKQGQFERESRPSVAIVQDEILSNGKWLWYGLIYINHSHAHANWNESLCAMALLTSLIPDSRHKADYKKVLYPCQVNIMNFSVSF